MLLLVFVTVLAGCNGKRDTDKVTEKIVKPSFPEVTMKGDAIMLVPKGSTYKDPGATGKDDLTGVTKELTPYRPETYFVDTSVPGGYQIFYLIKNENGYETKVSCLVIVFDPATQNLSPEDLSGTYKRNSSGRVVTVTKKGEGLFYTNDIYGTYTKFTPMYFVNFNTGLLVPTQDGGDLGAINGTGTVSKNRLANMS